MQLILLILAAASGGGTVIRRFPLVGAAQSRVSDTPLPAEGKGNVCLWQTASPPATPSFRVENTKVHGANQNY
jgi:hypothetical protein